MKIVLFILAIVIPTVLLVYLDYKMDKKNIYLLIVKDFFLLNLLTPTLLIKLFDYQSVFLPNEQNYTYSLIYFSISLSIIIIYLLIKYLLKKYVILEKNEKKKIGIYITSIILITLSTFIFTLTLWAKNTYDQIKIDEILVTMFSPKNGTDNAILIPLYESSFLVSLTVGYLFALIFYKPVNYHIKNKIVIKQKFIKTTYLSLGILMLISSFTYAFIKFDLDTFVISITQSSNYIEENYIDPNNTPLYVNERRNLIHIYLESIENSYFDKANGGNMDENLMPNLLELSKEGYSFSNSDKLGGPLETNGATWSVASMVNQTFGFTMKTPKGKNSYGKKGKFIDGAIGVGDILKELDYNQTLMIGADATFGALNHMFKNHGDFKIFDHKYAIENNYLPKNYNVNWGFEDEKLYEFAKDELTRLSKEDKPFHFVMENADTHFPGLAFKNDQPIYNGKPKDANYAKTIKFSDQKVVEFIRWIQKQDFYKNTTVIIIGDHNSMERDFFIKNDFNNYTRTTFNLILNPTENNINNSNNFINRQFATYDYMPTILSSIGINIKGNRLGLGTNLFSNEPTLYERDGYKYVNKEYVKKSKFYQQKFLNTKNKYDRNNLHIKNKNV